MKLEVNTKMLSRALKIAGKPITGKQTLPILDSFLMKTECELKRLIITGSNGETTIMVPITLEDCTNNETFSTFAKELEEVISLLPDQTITMETDKKKLSIKWKKGERNLPLTPVSEYPVVTPQINPMTTVLIPGAELSYAIDNTLSFCGCNSTTTVLEGLNFKLDSKSLKIAASDTHFLKCITLEGEPSKEFNFTLHSTVGNILKSAIRKEVPMVKIEADEKTAIFNTGEVMIIARTLQGRYPDYTKLMPDNNMNLFELVVDKEELRSALKRIYSCHYIVKMDISPLSVILTSENTSCGSNAMEVCDGTFNGEKMTIKAAAEKLMTILDKLNNTKAVFKLTSSNKAMYITGEEDTEIKDIALLMPIM